jgi:cytolysin-activating lysine-acyltransferase
VTAQSANARSVDCNDTVNGPQRPPTELSTEARRKNAASSKRLTSAFGEIVSILMRSPKHQASTIADLEWLVVPPVVTGQFSLAEAQSKSNGLITPIAVVLWAAVSKDVDARLSDEPDKPIKLAPPEWKGGDIVWIVEALGEPRVLEAMMKQLASKQWAGKQVKLRARGKDGKMAVAVLGQRTAPTQS